VRYWSWIILLVIILPLSSKAQNQVPVIINNNPSAIDEFENPITLNWTVIDKDLRGYEVYQGIVLIANGSYNHNYNQTQETRIELTFILDQGEYNFTLIVWDSSDQVAVSSARLVKGSDPPALATIPVSNFWIAGLVFLAIIKFSKQSRSFRYHLE